jgi:hypothetical protein
MKGSVMFQIGDRVWCKASKDGSRAYPKWVGEVKQAKTLYNVNIYLVNFDPTYDAKQSFLKTAEYYESKRVCAEQAQHCRELAESAVNGIWLTEGGIELAPAEMKVGFN